MDQFSDIKRMANQIAAAFGAYPEEQAVKETANHIKSFWIRACASSWRK